MRLHERETWVPLAQTELNIKLHKYFTERNVDEYVELLRLITFEIRGILLDMEPEVKRAETYSDLKDLIREHQKEKYLTDIELLQALFSYCESSMKWLLRYERHGDFYTPAGLEA